MNKIGKVTKQKVFTAAKHIALRNQEPTTKSVRAYLAFTGSQTTIHKYLKEWKLQCFKNYGVEEDYSLPADIAAIRAENQELKKSVINTKEHNQIISQELARTEKKNLELTQKLVTIEAETRELKAKYQATFQKAEQLESLYRHITEERTILLKQMAEEKDLLIASLRAELKEAHQLSLKEIQDTSYHGHDLLMQEKVKTYNLQEEVKTLTTKLNKLQQALVQTETTIAPLKKRLAQSEKFISEVITVEQMQAYEKSKLAEEG
jgi:septal ring factor EnvC (AmiA/AmiB activator)